MNRYSCLMCKNYVKGLIQKTSYFHSGKPFISNHYPIGRYELKIEGCDSYENCRGLGRGPILFTPIRN